MRKPKETLEEFMARLREIAVPAKLPSKVLKARFMVEILKDYPHTSPSIFIS